jgi:hypothetical protein
MLRLQFCVKSFFLYLRTVKPIFLFNPEHDLALANGDRHYIAPRNIREMARDLAELMSITTPLYEESTLQGGASPHPIPWGWDAACTERFKRMGLTTPALPTDGAIAALSRHSERGTAHRLLNAFHQSHPDSIYIGESLIVRSFDELTAYAMQHRHILLKAPLSGSGKGLRHLNLNDNKNDNYPTSRRSTSALTSTFKKIESWADALIRRHGYLTAEPYYDKVQDFAMEFCATDRRCHFIGYSLFTTDTHGRYDSNLLLSDADIEARLSAYIPRSILHDVCHYVETHADLIIPAEWDTSRFPITFGIDMMVVKNGRQFTIDNSQLTIKDLEIGNQNSEFKLHPCVEINLRCNMGIVAHEVRRHLMAPEATGIYRLALFPDHAALQAFDEKQRALYPALYRDGLLVRGYHPLTSIEGDTRHLAYIISKEV